jgi:hypothetical protein
VAGGVGILTHETAGALQMGCCYCRAKSRALSSRLSALSLGVASACHVGVGVQSPLSIWNSPRLVLTSTLELPTAPAAGATHHHHMHLDSGGASARARARAGRPASYAPHPVSLASTTLPQRAGLRSPAAFFQGRLRPIRQWRDSRSQGAAPI